MKLTRYRYDTIPLTEQEARKRKSREIECAKAELKHRKGQVEEAEERFQRAISAPLDTERRVQIALNPGDPGYDEASPVFNPVDYQGDIIWQTMKTP